MNANTTLRYPERFDPKRREVELHGEAFFEVEKAAGNPFVVKTNKMDIQVTGTKFNVNAYDTEEYFVASLVEGAVSVSCVHNRNSSYALQPRQQIVVSDHSSKVSSFENTDFMAWKEGVFIFDDMLLTDIIKKLELYYDVSIIVKNTKLGNFRYTGKSDNGMEWKASCGNSRLYIRSSIRKMTIGILLYSNKIALPF